MVYDVGQKEEEGLSWAGSDHRVSPRQPLHLAYILRIRSSMEGNAAAVADDDGDADDAVDDGDDANDD
eukprot:425546-Pyramimonas_sp.AAC.1